MAMVTVLQALGHMPKLRSTVQCLLMLAMVIVLQALGHMPKLVLFVKC